MPHIRPEGFNLGGGYFKTIEEAWAAAEPVRAKQAQEARDRVHQRQAVVTDIQEGKNDEWFVNIEFTTTPPDPVENMGERVIGIFSLVGWAKAPRAIEDRIFRRTPAARQAAPQAAVTSPRRRSPGKKQPQESRPAARPASASRQKPL